MTIPRPCRCGACPVCHLAEHDARYRALFAPAAELDPVPERCPHLWRRARDQDGKVKTRWCGTG